MEPTQDAAVSDGFTHGEPNKADRAGCEVGSTKQSLQDEDSAG